MSKKQLLKTILLGLVVTICSYRVVQSKNSVELHPKLKRGSTINSCYCTNLQGCVAAASGLIYCGQAVDCSALNSPCLSTE
jgi:hypothetical protein